LIKKILLILPYFGNWPIWLDAFMVSITHNPSINWLIPTDCEIPKNYPENIKFVSISLNDINLLVNDKINCNVKLTPKKFCDLKPAFGIIFNEYLHDYDFWGFTDLDIIYGNVRKCITNELLNDYEIISSRKMQFLNILHK
jgi:hypothetical protein